LKKLLKPAPPPRQLLLVAKTLIILVKSRKVVAGLIIMPVLDETCRDDDHSPGWEETKPFLLMHEVVLAVAAEEGR